MNRSSRIWTGLPPLVFLAAGAWCAVLVGAAAAQRDNRVEVKPITPYTGEPIFLPEPEPQPPATLVERIVRTEKYDNGQVRFEQQIARYSDERRAAEGFYREYYSNGQLFVEGTYRDGAQHDQWTYWHENGKKNRTVNYKNGQPDGSWEVYRADGTLVAKRGFKEGKREGTWTTYDPTGTQPLAENNYVDGKAHGAWKVWFPSGQLQREASFKEGARHGKWFEWSDEGEKRAEVNYVDGTPHGTAIAWTADGRRFVQEYVDGKIISRSQE